MTAEERKRIAAKGRADQARQLTGSAEKQRLSAPVRIVGKVPSASKEMTGNIASSRGRRQKTEKRTEILKQSNIPQKPVQPPDVIEVFIDESDDLIPSLQGRKQPKTTSKAGREINRQPSGPVKNYPDRKIAAKQTRRRRQTVAEIKAEREQVKEAMRTRILDGGGSFLPRPMPDAPQRRTIVRALLTAVFLAAVLFAGLFLWRQHGTYSSYRIVWEETAPGTARQYVSFQEGLLAVATDGVVFYDKDGGRMWQISYLMQNPYCETRGSYALVYDRTGKSLKIFDSNGLVGEATPGSPINTAVISRAGVVAAVLSETKSSRIVYYDREGRRIDVEIQSPILETGFPLDIAISPDGQMLAVAYYYVAGESGACRLMFYDFSEIGQDGEQMIAAFDYSDSDTYLSYLVWMEDTCVCAVGDNRISFYTVSDRSKEVKEKTVTFEGSVEKVFENESYVCLLMDGNDGKRIDVYGQNARLRASISQETVAKEYQIVGTNLIMTDEHSCRIEDLEGRGRLDLDFLLELSAVVPVGDSINKLYLALPNTVQKVNLR